MIFLKPKASRESASEEFAVAIDEEVEAYDPVAKRLANAIKYCGKSYSQVSITGRSKISFTLT